MTQKVALSMVSFPGVVLDYLGSTAPDGWVFAFGTIGNASSGASNRANADTEALFTLLWNSFADSQAPVSGGRGASAAADFAAGKTIGGLDFRGYATVGRDDMGGSAAGRMTTGGSGLNGTVLGAVGGSQTHTMTVSEMPSHGHPFQLSVNTASPASSTTTGGMMMNTNSASSRVAYSGAAGNTAGEQIGGSGGGNAHNNTQPSKVVNKIISL